MSNRTRLPELLVLLWCFGPIGYAFVASVSPDAGLDGGQLAWLVNYLSLMDRTSGFRTATFNSVFIGVVSSAVAVTAGAPAGFWIAQRRRSKEIAVFALVATRIIPPAVIAMPLFLMAVRTGLHDSVLFLSLIHAAMGAPLVAAIIAIQDWHRVGLLFSLSRLDGVGMVRAGVITIRSTLQGPLLLGVYFAFITSWNEFFFSILFAGSIGNTLPSRMAGFETIRGTQWGQLCASIVVVTVPALAGFVLFNKVMPFLVVKRPIA